MKKMMEPPSSSNGIANLDDFAQRVLAILSASPYEPLHHLSCECHADLLVLRGFVPTQHMKRIVVMLVNELERQVKIRDDVQIVSATQLTTVGLAASSITR